MINLTKQKTIAITTNKTTFCMLAFLIMAAAILYICFANTTVRTLAALEKTKQGMQSLSVTVSEMESKRLSVENNVSIEKATELGFVEVNNPMFIIKSSGKASLSLKSN